MLTRRHTSASSQNHSTTEQAGCVGKRMDQCNPLFQRCRRLYWGWGAPACDLLGGAGRGRSGRDRHIEEQSQEGNALQVEHVRGTRSSNPAAGLGDPTNLSLRDYPRYDGVTCPVHISSSMLTRAVRSISKMLRRASSEGSWQGRFCAVLVLMAVCLLTARVATRYGFSGKSWEAPAVKTLTFERHVTPRPGPQRLIKNSATWNPPRVCAVQFRTPVFYPRVAPAAPPVISLHIGESLYNRPPPASKNL